MSEESGGVGQPRLVVALRDGQRAEVFGDRIVVGEKAYPFADLTFAGLVIDPAAPPAAPGAPPPPALLLRLRDGRDAVLAPAESPAAWQLLGAVHQARPDLRAASAQWAPPPPPPSPGYGYPYGSPYGYYPRPASSNNDTVLAGIAHLGVFLGGWLLPLVIWLATRTSAPYASRQAKQAFFWQLAFFVLFILAYFGFFATFFASGFFAAPTYDPYGSSGANPFVFAPFAGLLIFYAVLLVGGLINMIFSIIGAVKGFQGKPFHYPLLGWLQ